ncbi:MAG: hypothetical protein H6767_01910 [Candidatus Peribacteria bacterium]|nr:MAG: hypothetical protein H6767_01910 [Candidatus Peribacteria bacterium]
MYPSLEKILKYNLTKDFKTLIQEYAQAEYDITPTYEVLSEDGPDHNKQFEVGIYLGEQQVGIGTGTSKKKAQEKAAEDGYMKMQEDDFQLFSQ